MTFDTRLTREMIDAFTRAGYWGQETYYDLFLRQVQKFREKVAIVDAQGRYTYGEIDDKVRRTAAFLRANGIGKGDVVTIQLPNRVEFVYVYLALEHLGAIANQINPDFRSREVEYILRFAKARAYVCAQSFKGHDYPEMVRRLRSSLPNLDLVCVIDAPGTADTVSLVEGLSSHAPLPEHDWVRMDANDIFRMAFTSGTTGNPKCVLHSFNTTLPAMRFNARDMRDTSDDVFLVYLPIGLNWGYLELMQALSLGARAVLLDRFSGSKALELIEREKVTKISTAPASIISMLNDDTNLLAVF